MRSYVASLRRRKLTAVPRRHQLEATSAFGVTYEETWENMVTGSVLQAKLESLGIYDEGLSEEEA